MNSDFYMIMTDSLSHFSYKLCCLSVGTNILLQVPSKVSVSNYEEAAS